MVRNLSTLMCSTELTEVAAVSHLAFVAAQVDRVCGEIMGEVVFGRFDMPDIKQMIVPFHPVRDLGLPYLATGDGVRMRYSHGDGQFSFSTTLHSVGENGSWNLLIPVVVEHSERRLVSRYQVPDTWDLVLKNVGAFDRQTVRLVDMSAAGFAVMFDPIGVHLTEGRTFSAELHVPGHKPMPLRARVKVVQPLEQTAFVESGEPTHLAGCELVGFGLVHHAELAAILAHRGQLRTGS